MFNAGSTILFKKIILKLKAVVLCELCSFGYILWNAIISSTTQPSSGCCLLVCMLLAITAWCCTWFCLQHECDHQGDNNPLGCLDVMMEMIDNMLTCWAPVSHRHIMLICWIAIIFCGYCVTLMFLHFTGTWWYWNRWYLPIYFWVIFKDCFLQVNLEDICENPCN